MVYVYDKGVVDGWRVYAHAQMQAEKGGGSGYHNMLAVLGDKQCDGRGISSPQVQASTLILTRWYLMLFFCSTTARII